MGCKVKPVIYVAGLFFLSKTSFKNIIEFNYKVRTLDSLGHLRIESLHNLQTFLFLLENQIYLSFQAETKLKIYGS